jgi:signal transduction histidine kinase
MAQVFLNLILNAIEEMHEGGSLKITLRGAGQNAAVSFANDGPAIPPDVMPHIFDPFFTTKPEGSGLGLSVSASLVQQQGGTITAENLGESRGVVFTVYLPFAPNTTPGTSK